MADATRYQELTEEEVQDMEVVPMEVPIDAHLCPHADFTNFPEDIYSACVVSLLIDPECIHNKSPVAGFRVVRMLLTLLLGLCTMFIQVIYVFQMKRLIVDPEMHDMLLTFHKFKEEVNFDSADGGDQDWDKYEDQKAVCNWGMTQLILLVLVEWQWAMAMFQDVRMHTKVAIGIAKLPPPREGHIVNHCYNPSGDLILTGVSSWQKFLILVLVYVPKLFIAAYILPVGAGYLHHTSTIIDLIINQFALTVVLSLDEYMYAALCTSFQCKRLAATKLRKYSGSGDQVTFFVVSLVVFAVTLGWVFFFLFVVDVNFRDFPYFEMWKRCTQSIDGWLEEKKPIWRG